MLVLKIHTFSSLLHHLKELLATTENIGPTDFELLEEAIAAVAEQKVSHLLVTSAPPDTVNSPLVLVVADGIASETLCDGQPHDLPAL